MTGTIVFEADPKRDDVTAVLVPADRTTRRPVTTGVQATLWDDQNNRDLPDRLVRNLSGALVLLNRPLGATYTFRRTDSGWKIVTLAVHDVDTVLELTPS